MKKAYLWVVVWKINGVPSVSADLFFSSKEKFHELINYDAKDEQLLEIKVPEEFNNWDFIPENY